MSYKYNIPHDFHYWCFVLGIWWCWVSIMCLQREQQNLENKQKSLENTRIPSSISPNCKVFETHFEVLMAIIRSVTDSGVLKFSFVTKFHSHLNEYLQLVIEYQGCYTCLSTPTNMVKSLHPTNSYKTSQNTEWTPAAEDFMNIYCRLRIKFLLFNYHETKIDVTFITTLL